MAITKVINDLAYLNQLGYTNALKGCAGTTAQQPASSSSIDYVIVAGGGAGGTNGSATGDGLGGGGAGGYITGTTTVYHGTPTVLTIGAGGYGIHSGGWPRGVNGNDSGFNGIRGIGGGGGNAGTDPIGLYGGSGGGGGRNGGAAGGSLDNQGSAGGVGGTGSAYWNSTGGGGGGYTGAGTAGASSSSGNGGAGGAGVNIKTFIDYNNSTLAQIADVVGTDVYVAGGGGGGAYSGTKGTAGAGGGGTGGQSGTNAEAGAPNSGGGGGGDGNAQSIGGAGGSGVVVLKYDNTEVTGYTLNSEDTYTVNWPADKYGVAYWPLNLDVKDVGGNYDGTATDITYTNGKFSQAASFNGSSSYIERANFGGIVNTSNAFSYSFWVYFNSISIYDWVIGIQQAGSPYAGVGLFGNASNKLGIAVAGAGPQSMTDTLSLSTWMHIAFTHDGSGNYKCYVNGGTPITYSGVTSSNSANPLRLGLSSVSGWDYFDGILEQVRIYTSELSLTDVQDIYNNSKPGSLSPLKTSSDLTTTTCNYPSGTTGTALYQFEGDATDTCTNYDLTATGSPSYVTGKFGTAIQFNGTSQGVTSTSAVIPNPAATISLWFNGNGTATTEFYIIGAGVGGSSYGLDIHYYNDGSGGHFYGGVVDGGSFQGVGTGDTIVDTNTWYHLALTWDGSTSANSMKLYLNGVLETNITPTVTAASLTYSSFGIGKTATSTYAPGIVDQVRIYGSVLTSQQIYDLWQKENDIQTYFPDAPTSGTDTLVFKEGSGEITFKNDLLPGAETGMLRYNSTLGQMEHFNSGGWKDFTECTTSICNYPITARCLYTFDGNIIDSCGNTTPDLVQNVYYNSPGKFDNRGFSQLGTSSSLGYSKLGWSSGLGVNYNTSDFSISLWLKQYSYASYSACGSSSLCYGYIWSGWSNSYWTLATDHQVAGNTIAWKSWGPGAGQTQTTESGTVDLNTWYHIVATRSTTNGIQLWLNNQLIDSVSGSWTAGTASVYDMIGGYGDTGYTRQGLHGVISQFRLFESVLTPEQISQLYNEVSCPNN